MDQAQNVNLPIRCLWCDYDLRAAGNAGKCPECGRAFVAQYLVIDGYSAKRSSFEDGTPFSWRVAPEWMLWAQLIGTLILLRAIWLWDERATRITLGLVGTYAAVVAMAILRLHVSDRPPLRLVCSAKGFSETKAGVARPTIQRWPDDAVLTLQPAPRAGRFRLRLTSFHYWWQGQRDDFGIDFDATAQHAEAIRGKIEGFRKMRGTPTGDGTSRG